MQGYNNSNSSLKRIEVNTLVHDSSDVFQVNRYSIPRGLNSVKRARESKQNIIEGLTKDIKIALNCNEKIEEEKIE